MKNTPIYFAIKKFLQFKNYYHRRERSMLQELFDDVKRASFVNGINVNEQQGNQGFTTILM